MELVYVTSNELKQQKAIYHLKPYGITIQSRNFDFEEIQSQDPEKILESKLHQAYEFFHVPVLVSDDTWNIPALQGFPGAYMKDMNRWFRPEDWLRLMAEVKDRRIFLEAYLGYRDDTRQQFFHYSRENVFLKQARGDMPQSPHLTVIGNQVDGPSLAQLIQEGGVGLSDPEDFWRELATWLIHGSEL